MTVRVVWLSAETPDVRGGGGQRRQYHQIRALLTAGIAVRVATLAGPQDDASVSALVPVHRFATSRSAALTGRNTDLSRFLDAGGFDGAVVAHLESLPHVRGELGRLQLPWLLEIQNVNSRWQTLHGEFGRARTWRRRERTALRYAAFATVCSQEERQALPHAGADGKVAVAGNGIDVEEWPPEALAERREPFVALFGAWGHEPNRQGARWLTDTVWPLVRRHLPQARLMLAGPGQPPDECLAAGGVEHAGRVDDLAGFLGRVRVAAVPIVRGIGARVKFGEALASGAAVVATSAGAEGFDADGAFVRADDPASFADACTRLLSSEREARALGTAGRALALQRMRWGHTSAPIVRWAQGLGR